MDNQRSWIWYTRIFNHVIRSNGLKVKSLLTISSNQGIKETVINGMGLSLLSRSVIERDVQHKNLSIIKLKNHSFNRTLSYVYSPIMADKKNVKTFIRCIKQKMAILISIVEYKV